VFRHAKRNSDNNCGQQQGQQCSFGHQFVSAE
jgi:hypothetical protein